MDNRTFGYARVSSREQHEDRQIEALTNYGVSRDNIIVDKCSGKDTEREGYQYLKKQILRNGDTLVIKELDRLSLKLSITLDTLTARILKLSSDSQSRIEPTPFYSWWEPTDCRADSAVTPVAHKISPDHRF